MVLDQMMNQLQMYQVKGVNDIQKVSIQPLLGTSNLDIIVTKKQDSVNALL